MTLHRSKDPYADRCPIRDVLERTGDRWTMLVLFTLEAQRMLAQTLRRLEQDGMVSRRVHPTVPPRVDYTLTPLGQSFLQPMHGLLAWAQTHHEDVKAARRAYQPPAAIPAL